MSNLITAARAKQAINQTSFTSAENTAIDSIVAAVSAAVQNWCRRRFPATDFDEVRDGQHSEFLTLDHSPVIALHSLQRSPQTVLQIRNWHADTQAASAQMISTGLRLRRTTTFGEVVTTSGLAFADCTTLQALADAVNALSAAGWQAQTMAPWNALRPDDLYVNANPGFSTENARKDAQGNWASFQLWTESVPCHYTRQGILCRSDLASEWHSCPAWAGGRSWWRIRYRAGYETIPEDVQEACAGWAAVLFHLTKRDPAAVATSAGSSYAAYLKTKPNPPDGVVALLQPYRRRAV